MLSEELASLFARVALSNGAQRAIGELDWLMMRVLRLHPMLAENGRIAAALDARLAPAAISANSLGERPYDWAWVLELQAEALRMRARWARALAPLAARLSAKMADLAAPGDPVRSGAHGNSAFACLFALDYARAAGDLPLEMEIRRAARRWYERDRDAPLAAEPSPGDLVSPALIEAVLMKQVLDPAEFTRWLNAFLPDGIRPLAEPPVEVGLCLTRAWCFRALGLSEPADSHLAAAMPHAAGADYAAFAVLALSAAAPRSP